MLKKVLLAVGVVAIAASVVLGITTEIAGIAVASALALAGAVIAVIGVFKSEI